MITASRKRSTTRTRFGVAEYLAAGPQLLAEWRDAWSPGQHPRGAALVAAAVDARRAGLHTPVAEALLRRLHEHYLTERGGSTLRPEPFEQPLGVEGGATEVNRLLW
jgi:hypothetical protein